MALHITITLSTDIYTVTQIPDLSAEHNNTAMSSKDTETKVAEVAAAPAPAPTSPKASTTKDASAASPSRRKVKLVKRTDFKVKKPVVDTLAEEKAFREAIALAFKKWDHNNDDTIDPSEVKQVLEESKLDASKEMVDAIIGPMDSNKNGRIEVSYMVEIGPR